MKKFTITVECMETYEVIAETEEEAYDKADEMFEKAEHSLYLEDVREILPSIVRILKIEGDENKSKVIFENGYTLYSEHNQDCCEWHYLDFTMLKNYNIGTATGQKINIYEQEFDFSKGIPFKKVDGVGILLIDTQGNKYLINGYGYNNGYYSDEIELVLTKGRLVKYRYDVTECQEWQQY